MRNIMLAFFLVSIGIAAVAQTAPKLQVAQIPDGKISGGVYSNDSVGVTYEIPAGWEATADPKTPTNLDWRGPDKAANRCSKVLLRLLPQSKQEGRYFPTAVLFVIDPECLGFKSFPKSTEDVKLITEIAVKIGKNYNYTPFMSPLGNQVERHSDQNRVIIRTMGDMVVNANEMIGGKPAKKKEPLNVSTSISFTEARNCWVAWAYNADEQSAQVLKNLKVVLSDAK